MHFVLLLQCSTVCFTEVLVEKVNDFSIEELWKKDATSFHPPQADKVNKTPGNPLRPDSYRIGVKLRDMHNSGKVAVGLV